MYLARNLKGDLRLFKWTPEYNQDIDMWYEEHYEDGYGNFNSEEYPEVTFENSPMEVELVLPSQEPTIGGLLNQLTETKEEIRKFREMVSHMRYLQKNYSSYESMFGERAKLDLKRREADVDRWLRETEETEFDD